MTEHTIGVQAPDQAGRVAVVTGANAGIGLETARELAARDATVVLACRNLDAAGLAIRQIKAGLPGADLHAVRLDLSSLDSVAECAAQLRARWPVIDLLINNAGVMASSYGTTSDGFETDFGTNFLGHFALTGRLIDSITASTGGRVVTVSSITHRRRAATLDFDDPQSTAKRFDADVAYARSKMAGMVFMVELQRRLTAAGSPALSVAAHPGGVRTNILHHRNKLMQLVYKPRLAWATGWFTQSPADGALPVLRAALDPALDGGEFFGPSGFGELVGAPKPVAISSRALDIDTGQRLWALAQELTGMTFEISAPSNPTIGANP
ncbi:oxidoreductase [Aldersonia kunmingensis]|uniref:oxidoreductase n=1 Tax=Aldersonia kunmingensis TaxID=408066 RepID=UPI00082E1A8F|nr:oxidoreductase [Aldersonia kunmingensis]